MAPEAPAGGAGGALEGGGQNCYALTGQNDNRHQRTEASMDGIEAIFKVEDDLQKERENREALVDALLV
jgi:hypothetical protein